MPPSTKHGKKLSDFDKADIIRRFRAQGKVPDIAIRYGVCAKTIRQVCAAEKINHAGFSGGANKELRKKQKFLNIRNRLDIIKRSEAGESASQLASIDDVSEKTIRRISQEKQRIEATVNTVNTKKLDLMKTYRLHEDTLEKVLYGWFVQKRAAGEPVTGTVLQEKALIISKSLDENTKFQASNGWLHRFKQRHGIHQLSFQGEILSANQPAAEAFKTELQDRIKSDEINLDRSYNADETGLFWRSLPKRTLVDGSETCAPGRKDPKDRITVMFCSNASGTHKITLFVIGKSNNPRCFKNAKLPVKYAATKSAWMTRDIFFQWFKEVFIQEVRKYHAENLQCSQRVYLILDNAPSHPSAEQLNSVDKNFEVMFLPPNVTSFIQSMDQGVIEKSKKLYKKSCLRELLLEKDGESICQFMKNQNPKDCCCRIANAREQVTPHNIRNAWENLLVTGNFEGQDLTNELEIRQPMDLVHRIPELITLPFEDVRKWLDEDQHETGWEILNAEQILEKIQKHLSPGDEQASDDSSGEEESRSGTDLTNFVPGEEQQVSTINEALDGL